MTDQPEKKLFVDEDWKSKVEAEKEAARHGKSAPDSADTSQPSADILDDQPDMPLPPASLTFLLTTLATQAMVALGQMPNPITGKAEVRLNQAKHVIDTLGMLETKTAGNRTPEESGLLDDLLHQLRMAFVYVQQMPAAK
jgi:hypothetical protein